MTSGKDDRNRCPYVGLQPFEESDREFFFGRERDQRIIISNLLTAPLTILYGASGVGKSSVLMAGVVPQLRRERPRTPIVVFRNWADKEFQMALSRACIEAVWSQPVDQPKPAESLPFDEILRACVEAAHGTVLVLLDQFEEYSLYHPKSSDPASFEAQFARAVNREDVDIGFLIALREDGLSKLDRFQERIPNLLSNRLRLNHLDADGAAAAIHQPLEVWNAKYPAGRPAVEIEDDLVREMIQQVRIGRVSVSAGGHGESGAAHTEEGFIEAPFLQLVMVRLWEEEMRAGSNRLRRETLDRLKGAKQIVRTHLDEVMSHLAKPGQAVCARFFDRLVTPTGGKVACRAADLASWAGELGSRVPEVLKSLSADRILRTVAAPDDPEATRYEIFHDVLAPAILDWQRRHVEARERAAAIEKARKQAAERALRKWILWLATMTVIAFAGWGYASYEGLRSKANQKAAESIYTSPVDPGRGLDLALEAVQTTPFGISPSTAATFGLLPTPAAEDALRQAIQASRLEWTLPIDMLASDIAISADGHKLATAGRDKIVKIWDISTDYPKPLQPALQHPDWVRDVVFLSAGDRLVTASHDTAYLWSLESPQAPLRSFVQGSPIYRAFAVSPDGRRLATASNGTHKGRVIKVWNLDAPDFAPQPITTIDVAGAWVMGLAFSPDGCCLATACVERGEVGRTSASVWRIETGAELLRLPIREASDAVLFTPDGKSLVTASRDARVRIWQPTGADLPDLLGESSRAMAPADGPAPREVKAMAWNNRILAGHFDRVRYIDISPDGSLIASAGADQTAKIWDLETGENLLTLIGHRAYVEAVKFSPDGRHVVTASRDRTVKFWNIEGHTGVVTSIAFGPDAKSLATGSSDRTAKLWDLSTGTPRLRFVLRGHSDQIDRLAFDPAGQRLATAGYDNTVRLWEVSSGAEIASLEKHADQVRAVSFSPDGKRLASAGADGHAWLYDLENPNAEAIRVIHFGKPFVQASALAFHPRQNRWATGGYDGKLQLWDFSGKNVGKVELSPEISRQRSDDFTAIAFSPDGKVIAALARRWVYLWPASAFDHPSSEPPEIITVDRAGYCRSMAYSQDGRQLAVACNDAAVRIFDASNFQPVKTITVHKNAVSDVAFSPDGTRLATASLDKTFHVSPLRFEDLYEMAQRLHAATTGEMP
jgi:WD40 repeat protein